jgi:hypothetical protein
MARTQQITREQAKEWIGRVVGSMENIHLLTTQIGKGNTEEFTEDDYELVQSLTTISRDAAAAAVLVLNRCTMAAHRRELRTQLEAMKSEG